MADETTKDQSCVQLSLLEATKICKYLSELARHNHSEGNPYYAQHIEKLEQKILDQVKKFYEQESIRE
jgi:hypothetical protein